MERINVIDLFFNAKMQLDYNHLASCGILICYANVNNKDMFIDSIECDQNSTVNLEIIDEKCVLTIFSAFQIDYVFQGNIDDLYVIYYSLLCYIDICSKQEKAFYLFKEEKEEENTCLNNIVSFTNSDSSFNSETASSVKSLLIPQTPYENISTPKKIKKEEEDTKYSPLSASTATVITLPTTNDDTSLLRQSEVTTEVVTDILEECEKDEMIAEISPLEQYIVELDNARHAISELEIELEMLKRTNMALKTEREEYTTENRRLQRKLKSAVKRIQKWETFQTEADISKVLEENRQLNMENERLGMIVNDQRNTIRRYEQKKFVGNSTDTNKKKLTDILSQWGVS
eukprot:TRINITY_DN2281_c0_g1_i1.p2 TRINITY_DN2281_c0_g1~~TRINITY_DN2281_c0_g1_i1.p2  ORF type:complete len:345 (-),score=109.45 TRINITY_DN2281_c0_g1_i1:1367-2401(-)